MGCSSNDDTEYSNDEAGYQQAEQQPEEPQPEEQPVDALRLQVVTTIFPQFDFVRQIAGDRVDLTMLISPGAESHAFEPTPRDMVTLYQADLFVYVCSDAEHWVSRVLESLERDDMHTVAMISLIDPIYTYHWGDDHDHGHHDHGHGHHDHSHSHDDHGHHDHDHDHDYDHHSHDHDYDHHDHDHDHHHHDHHHDHLYDEHVWTSPRNAILIVQALTETLAALDPANADFFRANAAAYISELEALDAALTQVVSEAARTTLVFGDRFPFIYLTEAYGLTAYAAFDGCSTETQVSPARVASLIDMVQDNDIPVVFYIELSNRQIAGVIAEATGAALLELHSAHNVSHADFTAGITYLEIMQRNIEHLREALR